MDGQLERLIIINLNSQKKKKNLKILNLNELNINKFIKDNLSMNIF